MSEWPRVPLGSVAVVTSGFAFKSKDWQSHGVPVVKIQNVRSGRVDLDACSFVSESVARTASRYELALGDVLITMSGEIGSIGVFKGRGQALLNQRVGRLEPLDGARTDKRFLAFALQHPRVKAEFEAAAYGVAQANISPSLIAQVEINVPGIVDQRRIAAVLSTLDDLIENNRRRIGLLEQIAQAIYREWFVHFRYPGNSDAEMSAQLADGWSLSTLGDQLDVLESGSRPRGGIDPSERGVPSVGAENVLGLGKYRFEAEKHVSESFYESMRRGRIQDGDVVLYKDGAKIGRHSLFRDGFPHSRCVVNEHVFRLRTRSPLTQSYLYFWIDRPETVEVIVALNSNAAQPGISQAKLASVPIPVPPGELVAQWTEVVEPMLALLFNLATRERTLRATRDELLPRLVTGAIDVSQLDVDALLDQTAA